MNNFSKTLVIFLGWPIISSAIIPFGFLRKKSLCVGLPPGIQYTQNLSDLTNNPTRIVDNVCYYGNGLALNSSCYMSAPTSTSVGTFRWIC